MHGVDERGHAVGLKRVSRSKLRETVAQLPPCLMGMEACSSAQYWAREFQKLGHTVKLISPQFVKPYVRGVREGFVNCRTSNCGKDILLIDGKVFL